MICQRKIGRIISSNECLSTFMQTAHGKMVVRDSRFSSLVSMQKNFTTAEKAGKSHLNLCLSVTEKWDPQILGAYCGSAQKQEEGSI